MKKKSALIIEDDYVFAKILSHLLQKEGYNCTFENDIPALIDLIEQGPAPDIYILDYELGNSITGLDLCRMIKAKKPQTPVLMLTGYDFEEIAVRCLDAGADQYLVKPYKKNELLARIRTALRSNHIVTESENLKSRPDLQLQQRSLKRRVLSAGSKQLKLTELEAVLLEYMMGNIGVELSRETLHSTLYGFQPDAFSRKIDVLIGRTKKKLESLDAPYSINNLRGYGYIMHTAPSTELEN